MTKTCRGTLRCLKRRAALATGSDLFTQARLWCSAWCGCVVPDWCYGHVLSSSPQASATMRRNSISLAKPGRSVDLAPSLYIASQRLPPYGCTTKMYKGKMTQGVILVDIVNYRVKRYGGIMRTCLAARLHKPSGPTVLASGTVKVCTPNLPSRAARICIWF